MTNRNYASEGDVRQQQGFKSSERNKTRHSTFEQGNN